MESSRHLHVFRPSFIPFTFAQLLCFAASDPAMPAQEYKDINGSDVSCTPSPTSDCRCTLSNGDGAIDLSRLQDNKLLTTKGIPDQEEPDIVYFFNPCGFLQKGPATSPCSPEENATICQSKSGQYYNIGQGPTITYRVESTSPYEIFLTYSKGTPSLPDYPSREATMSVVCDHHTELEIKHTRTHEVIGRPIEYSFKMTTKFGCPTSASHSPTISGGTIFLIIFFSALLLYLVCGVAYNRLSLGAQGMELIPHHEFWLLLPYLIKDGIYFVLCRASKRPYYEMI